MFSSKKCTLDGATALRNFHCCQVRLMQIKITRDLPTKQTIYDGSHDVIH